MYTAGILKGLITPVHFIKHLIRNVAMFTKNVGVLALFAPMPAHCCSLIYRPLVRLTSNSLTDPKTHVMLLTNCGMLNINTQP